MGVEVLGGGGFGWVNEGSEIVVKLGIGCENGE